MVSLSVKYRLNTRLACLRAAAAPAVAVLRLPTREAAVTGTLIVPVIPPSGPLLLAHGGRVEVAYAMYGV